MNILGIVKETLVDGEGLRYAIYCAGCIHACKGCHGENTWDANQGIPYQELLPDILNDLSYSVVDGITLSGGDPFYDTVGLLDLLKTLRNHFPKLSIWVYTGYTIEELLFNLDARDCLQWIDVVVDGKFIEHLADEKLCYRGSSNQHIIKVADYL